MIKSKVLHHALKGCECAPDVKIELDSVAAQIVNDVTKEAVRGKTRQTLYPDDIITAAQRLYGVDAISAIEARVLQLRHRGR